MFNSFVTFNALRRRGPAPALPLSHDDGWRPRPPAHAESRQSLACCWQPNAGTSRLECHWELLSHSTAGALE
jgi:hypothetical protein